MADCPCTRSTLAYVEVLELKKHLAPIKSYTYTLAVRRADGSVYEIAKSYSEIQRVDKKIREILNESSNGAQFDKVIPTKPSGNRFVIRRQSVTIKAIDSMTDYCNALLAIQSDAVSKQLQEFLRDAACQICNRSGIHPAGTSHADSGKELEVSRPLSLPIYRVEAVYDSGDKKQIRLTEHQLVKVHQKCTTGWWFVSTNRNVSGWYPASYLSLVHDQEPEEPSQLLTPEKYMVKESYKAQRADELSIEVGQELDVIQKQMDGWWISRLSGDPSAPEGYTPAVYLSPCDPELSACPYECMETLDMPVCQRRDSKHPDDIVNCSDPPASLETPTESKQTPNHSTDERSSEADSRDLVSRSSSTDEQSPSSEYTSDEDPIERGGVRGSPARLASALNKLQTTQLHLKDCVIKDIEGDILTRL